MKVLHINKYHYKRGGADSVYFNTAQLLLSKGHEALHFTMDYEENVKTTKNLYVTKQHDFTKYSFTDKITNLGSFFYNKDAAFSLKQLLQNEKPDIAHLHVFYGSLTSSILKVLKQYKIPVVVTIHDYKIVCPAYLCLNGKNEICEKCAGSKYYNCFTNNCIKNNRLNSLAFSLEAYFRDYFFAPEKFISKFIFVGNFSRNLHLNYKPGLRNQATVLYNFDLNISKTLPTPVQGNYFLYTGRLSKEKGVLSLIEAFKQRPHLKLKIVGKGPVSDEVGLLPSNIELCGFLSGADLTKCISNASFIMVPSECYENNPMAIIEAYALGKPVIAANLGGIPEIVLPNKTGFLFNSRDINNLNKAIDRAANLDSSQYLRMCNASRQFAEDNFHPDEHYKKLIEIYKSALQKSTVDTITF